MTRTTWTKFRDVPASEMPHAIFRNWELHRGKPVEIECVAHYPGDTNLIDSTGCAGPFFRLIKMKYAGEGTVPAGCIHELEID